MYRILIADDSNYMRETLRGILQGAGHKIVAEAINGPNTVEIYKALLPDIVMLDMSMPGESGLDTLRRIIRINDNAVVIMLAAVGKPEKVLEALNAGARGYVTKPFDETSLLKALDKATKRIDT